MEFGNKSNNYDFYGPLHSVNKICGLSMWILTGKVGSVERGYVTLKGDKILDVLAVIIILISICLFHFYFCPDYMDRVEHFSFVLLKYANYLIISGFTFVSRFYKPTAISIIYNVCKLDNKIEKLGCRSFDYPASEKFNVFCILALYIPSYYFK